MGLEIEQAREKFYFGATTFLLFFTFISGIALAATNQLATGLSLLISNVITVVACTLLLHFNVVTFAKKPPAVVVSSQQQPTV